VDFTAEFQRLLASEDAVVVSIASTQGSVPREAGTWMAVFASQIVGTIGGGHVEFEAIAEARMLLRGDDSSQPSFPRRRESTSATMDSRLRGNDKILANGSPQLKAHNEAEPYSKRYVLGPSLGQCCGGVMVIHYEKYSCSGNEYADYSQKLPLNSAFNPISALKAQTQRQNVALFGGGHVGKAIVHILSTLPMQVMWIDSRDEIFPADYVSNLVHNVVCEHSEPVQAAVHDLAAGSHVLIMSFSHAEDLDIVAACLLRQRERADLPFIGLIGSKTKWATFRHRLEDRGFSEAELAQITCPIGVEGVTGKEPEVIAVGVAAQLLKMRQSFP
jgi:xanthine dehydrogenase accessory factor